MLQWLSENRLTYYENKSLKLVESSQIMILWDQNWSIGSINKSPGMRKMSRAGWGYKPTCNRQQLQHNLCDWWSHEKCSMGKNKSLIRFE